MRQKSSRSRRKPPQSLDAWNLVNARDCLHFWCMTRIDNLAAQALLKQAIAIDPNYAQARAVLAVSHMFGVQMGWEPAASVLPIAERDALAAIRADEDDPWAHFALAMVYSYAGSIEDTLAEYETGVTPQSKLRAGAGLLCPVLTWVGRVREGAAAAGRAIRLSPRDPFSAIYYGVASYAAYAGRNYGELIRLGRESIRQRNDFVAAHRVITAAAGMTGDSGPREIHAEGVSAPASRCFAGPGPKLASRPGSGRARALHGRSAPRRPGIAGRRSIGAPSACHGPSPLTE